MPKKRDCSQALSAAEIVLSHRNALSKIKPPQNLRPGPAGQLFLSYEDCEFNYACYCQQAFSYRLQRVDNEGASMLRGQLRQLAQSTMFGCHETDMSLQGRQEFRCRLVGDVELSKQDKEFSNMSLPDESGDFLKVWIEYSVRVDQRGLPLEEASSRAMPILLESNGTAYEAIQEFQPRQYCSLDVHFSGKVFDLASCRENLSCLQRAEEAYTSAIRREFSQPPLGSTEIHDEPMPPGEITITPYRASNGLRNAKKIATEAG